MLFPSLAGSVLECQKSETPGYAGTRVWMALSTVLKHGSNLHCVLSKDSATSAHYVSNPFVQHVRKSERASVRVTDPLCCTQMMLDADSNGGDPPGIEVRAKPGLAGCEYLTEDVLTKQGTVIMGAIADMLRRHGYQEWDGEVAPDHGA